VTPLLTRRVSTNERTEAALQARGLSRQFGPLLAVSPLDIEVPAGTIVALMGPNGAGKSTLMLCLSGLLRPTTGDVWVDGFHLYRDEIEAKRRIAFVPDVPSFYPELSLWEHLAFMATMHGVGRTVEERASPLLQEFGLANVKDESPVLYSRGMRLKAGFLIALIRPLSMLLLDEPDAAADSSSVEALGRHLRRLRSEGAAVLFTTHDTAFASQMADQIWRMEDGRLSRQQE
jgi:ABC-2 type transport system ATP-binding protein